MAPLKINGFVQIRSKNRSKHTRASQWKEAVIQIVERKQKVNLVVSLKLEGRSRVFQLGDNVAGVMVSCCETGEHHLHLTLKDDTSLLIDKLSSVDVERLKSLLDSFHPCESQQLEEPKSSQHVLESSDPFCRKHQESVAGSQNTKQESGAPGPMKMPLLWPNSSSSHVEKEKVEKPSIKRKRKSTPSVEIIEEILEVNNPEPEKKSKTYNSRNKRCKGEKPMALRDQEKLNIWKLEPSFNTNTCWRPNLDDTILPTLAWSDESGSKFSQETQTYDLQPPLETYAKQLKREGFPNLGNTCYMNSILQSVFGIPTFAKDLLTQGIPWEKVSYDDLIKPLSQLLVLKDIRDIEVKGELLINVKKSISTVADTFLGDEQNDAHEFLSQCLDQLKLNMEKLNTMWLTEMDNDAEESSLSTYDENAIPKRFVCPVSANFEIELQSSIVCEACGEATLNTEVSNYLSVDLHQGTREQPLSIQKSLDLFFTPEKIERNCAKCKNKNSVLKYTLKRLPRVLIVHLKRYHLTPNGLLVKSQQPVEISKYLNVSSHFNENIKEPLSLTSKTSYEDCDVPNVSEEMMPEILSQPIPSRSVKNYEKINVYGTADRHTTTEMFNYFYDLKEQMILEGSQEMAEQLLQNPGTRFHKEFLPQGSPQSVRDFAEDTEKDMNTSLDLRDDIDDEYSLGAWWNPESSNFLGSNYLLDVIDESESMVFGDDPQNYRLVSVVSHFGSSQDSGHYVSDVYDFQKQAWLLYSDVQVFEIPEALIQENRLHTGYIFFYMRNELFEWLLKKASECKLLNTPKEQQKNMDLFSTLLNGFTYFLEES
nr:ubiquitin carboxyl-terminal hydrolase 29-like [Peromyscus maniculatus bairdii]XP_042126682.1 ubiquitin carboxyl-terminal hydrolase 29-like [Peromyscus maniculatus bairdii]XP_042126684.1 ubiquitin carboxyl-terminal hydrolase 29-like [Peromyscus maniculatus bairdii]XP_042126690.1 ubiquitin carboxyl-terminal hydrolase 29-like [Peromyscus maniculatus bairdii]XP_042126694.1 ubiquitin carboxyl-terminal hydrolase 29-like [Peromyscus maniculatus bairdii]XP_042126697.1 ubiquitin carboxyl-terminal hy